MTPDFTHRADPTTLPELMDAPCSYETLRACLEDISRVNRLTLSYRPTLTFLARVTQTHIQTRSPLPKPIHILDIGSGFGDTLRVIDRWAARRRIPVTLTGIDLNPLATRAAREATPPSTRITWITGDAVTTPLPHPPDLILSSLVTHHLPDPEIVRLLRWMESTARLGWFLNDLERRPTPARLFGLLARTLRWHPFVQHDGPVSFRRAFRTPDWHALLAGAGIPPHAAVIRPMLPARLCVDRLRPIYPATPPA